ncbi:MAG: DUF3467 domain-containing protein [Planctomycetes bacterium]|nr:DUF3467 domain-containing protein [Planctomycetota bacterium]
MSEVAEQLEVNEEENGHESKLAARRAAQQPQPIEADDSQVVAAYSNFCRVTGTPEELIVDFGLNTQGAAVPTQPIKLTQRVVMNYYTAKRLLGAMQMSIARHEQAFGVLETNVQKRVSPQPR